MPVSFSRYIYFVLLLPASLLAQECTTLIKESDAQQIQFLKDAKRVPEETACIIYAIKNLGSDKYHDAIAILTTYLDFEDARKSDINSPIIARVYPATDALYGMGKQSLPALLKVLSSEKPSQKAQDNAVYTIMMIHGTNMPQGVKLIKTAADHAETSIAKEYLNKAAENAIRWCVDEERLLCEAALKD